MNNKEILIDFIEYAKSRHVMPILHSNIEPLVDDYLSSRNTVRQELCLSCHTKEVAVKGELYCNACFAKNINQK